MRPSRTILVPRRVPGRSRGAAIISVLLTVVLATVIISAMVLRQHVTVRSVDNRIALTQTRWAERAAIDWAKVILANDPPNVDHASDIWAPAVAETRLDETVTAGAKIDDDARAATLSGQIFDAQARFNVSALARIGEDGMPTIDTTRLAILERLLTHIGQPAAFASAIAARVLAATPKPGATEVASALPLTRIADLRSVRGMREDTLEALDPYLSFLPTAHGVPQINLNTAPAELIAAALDIDLGQARQLVDRRETKVYGDLKQFGGDIVPPVETLDGNVLSVNSRFFIVRGLIRLGRVESFSETLLERESNKRVTVIWQRRL
ncbi:MAG: type II secretion system minor pseudopilin GspK [Burkholderiaceae bacterium]